MKPVRASSAFTSVYLLLNADALAGIAMVAMASALISLQVVSKTDYLSNAEASTGLAPKKARRAYRPIKSHIASDTICPGKEVLVQLMNLFEWIIIVFFSFTNV